MQTAARFDLARAYLADGYDTEALAALDALPRTLDPAAATPGVLDTADWPAKVDFLRGQALHGLGRDDEALAAYTAALTAAPMLAETVAPRLGQLHLDANNLDEAAAAYRQAADSLRDGRGVVAYVLLLEALADIQRSAGNYAGAVESYDEILGVAQNGGYRADIQQRAGATLAAAGDEAGAIERWRAATAEAPDSQFAYDALVELVSRDAEFDLYQRGYIDLAAEAWLPAINAYQAFLDTAAADDERRGRALQELGVAYIGAGNYPAAITALDQVIAESPACDCFGDAWLAKAQALALQGDRVGARRIYRTFAREYPAHPQAADALWRSGLSAFGDDNQVEAALDLLSLADGFPESDRAPDALNLIGLGAILTGLPNQAAGVYTRLQADYPDYRPHSVGYWLGRAHAAEGDGSAAEVAWQAAAEAAPDVYYGLLAAEALAGFTQGTNVLFSAIPEVLGPPSTLDGDDRSQAFAEAWLATWIEAGEGTLADLPAEAAADPDLAAVRFLLAADARGEALPIAQRLYDRYEDDPRTLYPLSLEFERLGLYRLSLIGTSRLLGFSPARLVEDTPIFLQEKVYPRPFSELIEPEAAANGLDPLLLYSLIRQESLFEEGARSYAAAQGLAQIIPDTGQWVADQLGYPDYRNELVYRPYINVKFGAYYLDRVRDYLGGDLVGALVGYNAGPGNAQRWREQFGDDDPIYVERLTYSEPRAYIQNILPNYYHYTRLYGQE